MIIVQGEFEVAPEDRETFLAESVETQQISRAEPGCIEYVFANDPLHTNRVVLSERWESRADLDAHLTALFVRRNIAAKSGATRLAPISSVVSFFEASSIEVL